MPIDRDELLNQARREREALGRTIQYANPDMWDSPSPCAGWRTRDVVGHLAASDTGVAATLAGDSWPEMDEFMSAHPADGADPDPDDLFNNWTVERRADANFRDVVNEWSAAADRVLVHAAKIDPDEWEGKIVHWFGEDFLVGDFLQTVIADWWTHGEDIRAGVELAPRAIHWPVYILNDIAIRRLPITLQQIDRDFSGMSVGIHLDGVGEGDWVQPLTPDETATGKGYVTIEGSGHAFGLIAARRISADLYLESGDIVIGGDEDIAFDVLENIRSY
jgi:uncharacterized protein (TIGR03083 family)